MVDIARHSSQLDSLNLQLRNLMPSLDIGNFWKPSLKKFSSSNNNLFLKPYKSREISWQWRHVILFSGFWWCSPFPWTHLWWDVGEFRIADEGQSPLSKKALLQQYPSNPSMWQNEHFPLFLPQFDQQFSLPGSQWYPKFWILSKPFNNG